MLSVPDLRLLQPFWLISLMKLSRSSCSLFVVDSVLRFSVLAAGSLKSSSWIHLGSKTSCEQRYLLTGLRKFGFMRLLFSGLEPSVSLEGK